MVGLINPVNPSKPRPHSKDLRTTGIIYGYSKVYV